jgi:hypothetical protein
LWTRQLIRPATGWLGPDGLAAQREVRRFMTINEEWDSVIPFAESGAGTKIFVTKKVDEIMNDRGKKIDTRAACGALFGVIASEVARAKAAWAAVKPRLAPKSR